LKPGLVEEAEEGILFLDEVGELDISLQPKLLRFLENGMARRVGSTRDYRSGARVISATNRDLKRDSDRGRFRLDLYYRLSEVVLNLPPLRQRMEDIPDLAPVFLKRAAERLGKNFETLEPELISKFQRYDWPGNIRELKQVVERLAIHYDGPVMRAEWWEVPEEMEAYGAAPADPAAWGGAGAFPGQPLAARRGVSQSPFSGMPGQAPAGWGYPPHPGAGSGAPNPARGMGAGAEAPNRPLNRKEKQKLAAQLIQESDGELTWVAAQIGVHPTTLYRWRKDGKV
jgi:DNA-binding NtrC family response regulator